MAKMTFVRALLTSSVLWLREKAASLKETKKKRQEGEGFRGWELAKDPVLHRAEQGKCNLKWKKMEHSACKRMPFRKGSHGLVEWFYDSMRLNIQKHTSKRQVSHKHLETSSSLVLRVNPRCNANIKDNKTGWHWTNPWKQTQGCGSGLPNCRLLEGCVAMPWEAEQHSLFFHTSLSCSYRLPSERNSFMPQVLLIWPSFLNTTVNVCSVNMRKQEQAMFLLLR